MLWLYKLGRDGASIAPAWPAFKLKSDYQHREQVHPEMCVCLEAAEMCIAQGPLFASELDHYDEDTTHFNPSEVWSSSV